MVRDVELVLLDGAEEAHMVTSEIYECANGCERQMPNPLEFL